MASTSKKSYPRRIKTKRYKCRSPRILCTKKHGIIITEKSQKIGPKKRGKKGGVYILYQDSLYVKKRNQKTTPTLEIRMQYLPDCLYIYFSLHAFCNSLQSGAVLGGDKVCTANVCPANTV